VLAEQLIELIALILSKPVTVCYHALVLPFFEQFATQSAQWEILAGLVEAGETALAGDLQWAVIGIKAGETAQVEELK
jgi:hypothetical protein